MVCLQRGKETCSTVDSKVSSRVVGSRPKVTSRISRSARDVRHPQAPMLNALGDRHVLDVTFGRLSTTLLETFE